MDNDDLPVGRILSRREVITLLGGAGLGLLAPAFRSRPALGATGCMVKPELTIGPYFVDEHLNRSDIRSDPTSGAVKPGKILQLTFNVTNVNDNCAPVSGAQVDVWHCDAGGLYSDESANGTLGQKFLRGYQVTDANGQATFTTIYPGWYPGRTVHIHFRIRNTAPGETYDFVSQLFFSDTLSNTVFAQAPYASHTGNRALNSQDNIYNGGGSQLLLSPVVSGDGYAASIDIGLNLAVSNHPPPNDSIAPASGSGAPGSFSTFTTRHSDVDGAGNLAQVLLRVGGSTANGFRAFYNPLNNKLFVLNDAGTAYIGGYAPGSAHVIANSQGSLDCAQTNVSLNGNQLTVNWSIIPAASLANTTENVFLYCKDRGGLVAAWQKMGTWTITP